jgi:L-amino acid N-acyltransferase YncA
MKTELVIRESTGADISAITEIYKHHVRTGTGTFEIDPPDEKEIARRHSDLVSRGFPWLVAELDGKIIGYAYAAPFRAREAYRFTLEDSIYVDSGTMRQGVGVELLRKLIAVSRSKGFRQIIALIGDSNNIGSIRVHERCGFKDAGVLKDVGLKFDRWLDVVMMQLEL